MAWIVENRLQQYKPTRSEPYITGAIRNAITEKYFPRYPRKQAALLPLFHLVMHEYGYIPEQAIDEAAALLEITPAQVQDAVSFYEEFRLKPTGKYVVQVCRSIACELCGYEAVLEKLRQVFGIDAEETTEDQAISLFEVECLGACEQAPCALVNGRLCGNLAPDAFARELQQLHSGASADGNGSARHAAQPHTTS